MEDVTYENIYLPTAFAIDQSLRSVDAGISGMV